jgi:hypothetical protein
MNARLVRAAATTASAVVTCALAAPAGVLRAEEPGTLHQELQSAGVFERIVVDREPPLQLAELVGRADLVVEASAVPALSRLNQAGTDIYTDYTFTVHAVIKNRRSPGLRAGDTLTVRRESGTVVIGDRPAIVIENAFPPFAAGEPYFLFLSRSTEQLYSVIGGGHGVYRAGDAVAPLGAAPLDAGDAPVKVSRAAFVGEVRALLRFAN